MDANVVALVVGLAGALIGAGVAIGVQLLIFRHQEETEKEERRRAEYVAVRNALADLEDALLDRPRRISIRTMPELSALTRALSTLPPKEESTDYLYRMRSLLIHAHAMPPDPDVGPILLGAVNSASEVVTAILRDESPAYPEEFIGVAELAERYAGLSEGSESSSPEVEFTHALGEVHRRSDEFAAAWRKCGDPPWKAKVLFRHWRQLGKPQLTRAEEDGRIESQAESG